LPLHIPEDEEMSRALGIAALALGLSLAGCSGGGGAGEADNQAATGENASAGATADAAAGKAKALKGCPFRKTINWVGSVENGYLRINGDVDLMMAGFKPQLTLQEGGPPGVTRLELALVPEPNADISSHVRLEKAGAAPNRRAEIWCSGERIAAFDMVVV
jgi:hypothetical protein